MLEGLEISEILYSYVKNKNEVFRIDSSFFQKQYLLDESIIRNVEYSTLKKIGVDLKSFGAYSLNNKVNYQNCGVPFIRGVNMKKGRINFNDMIYIDELTNALLWKSEVKPLMILLSMSGTIGDVAIASTKWAYPVNSNQDIAKLDTKGKINPYYLYSFLSSKFGQNYLKREARGSVQQHVFLSQMEQFEIPLMNDKFVDIIQGIIELSENSIIESESSYQQAEIILLETLGLGGFELSEDPVNIKNFKESFGVSKRLDAEYYQKKYEDYLRLIFSYKNSFEKLHIACNLKDNNFNPLEETFYKYIELSNIGRYGEVNGYTEQIGKYLPSRARRLVNAGDVVISSIEGSLQSCAVISKEYDNALCSTGFYVINSAKINSETLLVLFKSEPMQAIMKQHCSGTILTAMNKDEFSNIPVPLIDHNKQKEIAELVEESFKLKVEGERLLEVAKKAVEIAIEVNEDQAMKYIEDNT